MGFCAPGPPLQGLLALKSREKLFDHVGQSEESETGKGNWAQRSQASGPAGETRLVQSYFLRDHGPEAPRSKVRPGPQP